MPSLHNFQSFHRNIVFAILCCLFMIESAAMILDGDQQQAILAGKSIVDTPTKLGDHQQPARRSGPMAGETGGNQFEGSGSANPDDEDGDVDEGSGDGIEGSGAPPDDSSKTSTGGESDEQKNIINRGGAGGGSGGIVNNLLQPTAFTTITDTISSQPSRPPALSVPPPFVNVESTPRASPVAPTPARPVTATTQTTTKATTAATTPPTQPRGTTATTPWPTKQPGTPPPPPSKPTKQSPAPPPYFMDPTNSLDQLKPGIFAIMIGGAVVLILFIILVVTYLFYRIRKKDEGSYTCEEPIQPHHYSYAYQKASIKEFYA